MAVVKTYFGRRPLGRGLNTVNHVLDCSSQVLRLTFFAEDAVDASFLLMATNEQILMVGVFPGIVTYWRGHDRFSCRFQRYVDEES